MPNVSNGLVFWLSHLILMSGGVAEGRELPRGIDAMRDPPPVLSVDCLETGHWKNPWVCWSQGGLICNAQGKILATGGTEKGIGFWDVPKGKRLCCWEAAHGYYSWQIKLSADGRVLAAAGGKDQRVILVSDVQNGKIRRTWTAPEYLLALDVSADGKLVASISNRGTIHVWDTADGKERATFQGWAAVFGKDGTTLVIGSHKKVGVWDLATGKELRVLEGTATSLTLSADGKVLAGAGEKGIHVWDLTTGRLTRTIAANMGGFHMSSVRISANGRTVALTNDEMIAAWDAATGKIRFQMPGNWWYMPSALSDDGGTFVFSNGSEVECRNLAKPSRP